MTSPVASQPDAVELQLKLERAEPLYYLLSTQVSKQLPGGRETTTAEGRLVLRVLDVEPDGTMAVESVIEDLRVTTDGQVAGGLDTPEVVKIRHDGTIVIVQGSEQFTMPLYFARGFPRRLLRVGDSWGSPFNTQQFGATVNVSPTHSLASIERTEAGRAAHVRTLVEGTVTRFNLLSSKALPLQAQVPAHGTVRGSGEAIWLVERGRLLRSTVETSVDLQFVVGQTSQGHVTGQATVRLEALPPDTVVAAAVNPDVLIAPGKTIGPSALDQRMDALVGKLGSPGPGTSASDATMWGADRGFRATAVTWPNRFVAYVDPQDRSAILGLGTADSRFRTGKGLGLSSSEGAVLFTQGMSPTRLNMTSRSGSPEEPIRVLIYNDQGIAYAITAQDDQAKTARTEPIVGTVRWIAVFPPGSAGKIFLLP